MTLKCTKSNCSAFSVGKQEAAVPLLYTQPQVYIVVNTCKMQTELVVQY